MNRAVFLDRDGVINRPFVLDGRPYPPPSVDEFEIYPGVAEALRRLKRAGFLVIVATNQPDVSRGTQTRETVEAIHRKMCEALPVDRVEVCYDSASPCYKPQPGMLLRAARELEIDLANSYMVGDRWRDIDCGRAAGCASIWIDRGYAEPLRAAPDYTAQSLPAAVDMILGPEPMR